jgi:hypothetical protein
MKSPTPHDVVPGFRGIDAAAVTPQFAGPSIGDQAVL